MGTKIILDTDIGSDIDDAVCLAYLLAQPACNLLGVTTVSGEPFKRAQIADIICKVADKQVPIYPGTEAPLIIAGKQPLAQQASALPNWPHRSDFPRGEAIDFLRRTIRKYPGEITLLGIGPMTNVALLFSIDPEIPAMLKGLTVMAGNFTPGRTGVLPKEWNVVLDPHAADIVYRAPVAVSRSIGLDVTSLVKMDAQTVRERFQHKLLRPVLDFAEVWFKEAKEIVFHDPLAAATIFDDTICGFGQGVIEIETSSEKMGGYTYWNHKQRPARHEVATTVNPERFFEHFFSMFK